MSDLESSLGSIGKGQDAHVLRRRVNRRRMLQVSALAGVGAAGFALVGCSDGGGAAETAAQAQAADRLLQVELSEFALTPATLNATVGEDITVAVHNVGGVEHNFVVEGVAQTPLIRPGEQTALHLGKLAAGTYNTLCSVPGHADLGMRGTLLVTGAAATAAPTDVHPAQARGMTPEEMDASYMERLEAFPAPTQGQGNQPLEPTIVDGVKVFELTASEIEWEVEPGDFRQAMAYNGMVPGPQIRVQLGDRVRIILHNELQESTAIHWHGLLVPNDQDGVPGITQPLVKHGESHTYEFTVRNTGTHMYHSHMNGANQIPLGLLGAFIVEGPDEPQVDQDVLMVLNDGPLGYTFNGKGFPATQPFVVQQGQRLRIRYMNEGLQIHTMHLHGLPQTVIAQDGYPVPQPYQADTILLGPGQRFDVLVDATDPGVWAFHCHILSHAENERGMFGMVTVVIVQAPE